jgi:hypothetical protein
MDPDTSDGFKGRSAVQFVTLPTPAADDDPPGGRRRMAGRSGTRRQAVRMIGKR